MLSPPLRGALLPASTLVSTYLIEKQDSGSSHCVAGTNLGT